MKYHYKATYKFSSFFNTLWRMAIAFPVSLGVLYYFLNYMMNSPFPLWIVIVASVFIVSIMFLIGYFGNKGIKRSDIYYFYITDEKVVSEHPLGTKHRLSYEINMADIVVLSSYASSSPSYGVFKIKTENGNTFEVPGNYVNAGKALKTIRSIRPDLSISRQHLQSSELNSA